MNVSYDLHFWFTSQLDSTPHGKLTYLLLVCASDGHGKLEQFPRFVVQKLEIGINKHYHELAYLDRAPPNDHIVSYDQCRPNIGLFDWYSRFYNLINVYYTLNSWLNIMIILYIPPATILN